MNDDLLGAYSRMFSDYSLPETEETCSRWSQSFSASGIVEDGELLMLNTSEFPSEEEGYLACSLVEILEPLVAAKYYLSEKACQGILRRAGKRGVKLPEHLREALEEGAATGRSQEPTDPDS